MIKINYDMTENYKCLFNKANGIYFCRKRLNKNIKIKSYWQIVITLSITTFIISFITLIIALYFDISYISEVTGLMLYFTVFFPFMCIIPYYNALKLNSNSKKGVIEINKYGITDKSENGFSFSFSYQNIESLVITNDLIVFFTNSPIMIFIQNQDKEKIISKIKEYSKIKIIDKTN